MVGTLDTIILLLASVSILVALFFGLRAWQYQRRSAKATYGVAQQETRQAMRIDIVRGIAAVLVGLILMGVVGLSAGPEIDELTATPAAPTIPPATLAPAATAPSATVAPAETLAPLSTEPPTPLPTATEPEDTPTATVEPTATATAQPATATVNSEVGVWLRQAPGVESETVEWLLDGTLLTLLPGVETVDELDWQHVSSPEGNEGWVAVPYIVYNP